MQQFKDLITNNTVVSKNTRARRWCFVENNPVTPLVFDSSFLKFLFYSKEKGESGTPHYQGYLVSNNPSSLTSLKKWNNRAHFIVCKGSEQQNIDYISKSPIEGPFEHGQRSQQGKRTDLEHVSEMILSQSGTSIHSVATEYPSSYIRYFKGINALKNVSDSNRAYRFEKPYVEYIFGPTGVGKTKRVYDLCLDYINKNLFYKLLGSKGKWWDGYDTQKIILIDEFYGQIPISKINSYLDGYPLQVEIKGSTCYKNWDIVFITSTDDPNDFYKSSPFITDACRSGFIRRLDSIIRLEPGQEPLYLKGDSETLKKYFEKLNLTQNIFNENSPSQITTPVPDTVLTPVINIPINNFDINNINLTCTEPPITLLDGDISTQPYTPEIETLPVSPSTPEYITVDFSTPPKYNLFDLPSDYFKSAHLDVDKNKNPQEDNNLLSDEVLAQILDEEEQFLRVNALKVSPVVKRVNEITNYFNAPKKVRVQRVIKNKKKNKQ